MSLDTQLRRVARTVLRRVGTVVTFRQVTVGTYSYLSGTATPTTTDTAVRARVEDYTERELSGTVLLGDKRVIIAAVDLETPPRAHDLVVFEDDGPEWDVVRVVTHYAQHEPALYELQVRG